MHPLWLALFREFPEISLSPPNRPERRHTLKPTGAYRRLYRRVIEVHDGLRRLAEHVDPAVTPVVHERAVAAGAVPREAAAMAQAASIAVALRARHKRAAPSHPPPSTNPGPASIDGDLNVETEAAWLATVSVAYRDSAIVKEAVSECARRP